jgi:hypothetical protein
MIPAEKIPAEKLAWTSYEDRQHWLAFIAARVESWPETGVQSAQAFLAHDDIADDQISEGLSLLALGYFNMGVIDYAKKFAALCIKRAGGQSTIATERATFVLESAGMPSLVCKEVVTFFPEAVEKENEWEDCSDSEDGMGPLPG